MKKLMGVICVTLMLMASVSAACTHVHTKDCFTDKGDIDCSHVCDREELGISTLEYVHQPY